MKEKADLLQWIRRWKRAGAVMEKLRRADLDDVSVQQAIESLDDAFQSALHHCPPKSTSGLVEMQAWFSKMRP